MICYDTGMMEFTERDDMVIATFTEEGVALASDKARERRESARSKGRKQAYFIEGTEWDSLGTEVQSMMSEYAVAHYFGQTEWGPIMHRPDRNEGDVVVNGVPIEVKSTSRTRGCLPLKDDERRSRPYVLTIVNVAAKRVTIAGWIMAQDGKNKDWWRSDVRYPAYFVPQDALLPMDMLKRAVSEDE